MVNNDAVTINNDTPITDNSRKLVANGPHLYH